SARARRAPPRVPEATVARPSKARGPPLRPRSGPTTRRTRTSSLPSVRPPSAVRHAQVPVPAPGPNSVVEALRAGIPAKALHVAIRIEMDDRVKESLKLAAERGIPLLETGKPELDRMTEDAVHQGLVLQIPPYEYEDAYDLAETTIAKWKKGHISNAPI